MDPSSFIGVIWDAARCFCGCVQREADFVFDLETNLKLLEDKSNKLEEIKKDVEAHIEEAKNNPEMKISHQRTGWLQRVGKILQEINDIEPQGVQPIQNKCPSKWCSRNCASNYKLGKNVAKMLKRMDELTIEGESFGKDFIVAHEVPPKAIEMPLVKTVGLDLMFEKVWNSIEADNVGVIGLYGMGGVGKTTLLKKVNNELGKKELGFKFVIWVVVSKEPNLDSIMNNIRELIGIKEDEITWSRRNKDERAAKIYKVLKQKKFVLLLDDIWDEFDLQLVGVPRPGETNFQSKVLFTTRLKDVCGKMKAESILKVETLTEEEALELFCIKVGEDTLKSHPRIPKLAEEMAKKCNRLPLALIVVGSAMAGVKSMEAWEHSIKNLTGSILTAPDLEKKVFSILKFSYDRLDEVLKRCFLYCALYPEDSEIRVLDLIDEWMWEKSLGKDVTKSVEDMRGHGESIIEKLKLSCLLESVEDDIFMDRTIKMHDTIRDMALWVAHDENTKELMHGISIMDYWELRKILDPLRATTLILLKEDYAYSQCLEVVACMKRLKVLKLKVRGELSIDIGGLISLEHLSLKGDEIPGQEFFNDLQCLTNLKFLNLEIYNIERFYTFPLGVLPSLQQLRVFRLLGNCINISEERSILEELESLPNMEDLWIDIRSTDGLNKVIESTKLQSCISELISVHEDQIELPLLLATMSRMKQLQRFNIYGGLNIGSRQYSSAFDSCCLTKLRIVRLWGCSVTHVTWLKDAPLLQQLHIAGCSKMEEVIKDENNVDSFIFSSLVTLNLRNLPRLESIYKAPLPFPSLKSILISDCPNLKKLPLNSNSAKHKLTCIDGQEDWWNNLAWDDPAVKDIFHSKFQDFRESFNFVGNSGYVRYNFSTKSEDDGEN